MTRAATTRVPFGIVLAVLLMLTPLTASPASAALATDWKTVSAGLDHTCAIRSVGKLYCWGEDAHGQAGNGATIGDVISPKQVTSATDWKVVSAGSSHTCAIRSVGKLYCWGYDGHGEVGNGATIGDVISPKQVTSATDWKTVSAGDSHTCAIRSVGKLYCWGEDAHGQVGNGARVGNVTSPAQITSATDWRTVDVGDGHTCAVRGKLYCWGDDGTGEVGNGAVVGDVISPAQITSATDWKTVSTGTDHTCAVRSVGKLYCWGYDGNEQVGNGATVGNVTSPAQITSATDWKAVSAGEYHTCAVRGKLYCWGDDGSGQVGNGASTGDVTSPAQITAATDWKAVAAGSNHTCAVRGKLYCWGDDGNGQVGDGAATGPVTSPKQV